MSSSEEEIKNVKKSEERTHSLARVVLEEHGETSRHKRFSRGNFLTRIS